jgi:hypothetical protein
MAKSKPKARTLPRKAAKKKRKVVAKKAAKKKAAKTVRKKVSTKPSARQVRKIASPTGGTGTISVTYELTKSPDVSMASIYFNTTQVNLQQDRSTTDPNKFKSKNPYPVATPSVRVRVNANGLVGGGWTMTIFKDGLPGSGNPIEEDVNENGRADHDALH